MKVRVWNRTGLDLWVNVFVTYDKRLRANRLRILFRPWGDNVTGQEKDVDDRLKDGQIGSWDALRDLPDSCGMPDPDVHALGLPFTVQLTPHQKGWLGRDVFILTVAPEAIN